MYRSFLTDDGQLDVQYREKGTMKMQSGYRMWPSRIATLASAKQGISEQLDVAYGSGLKASLGSAIILLTSFGLLF